jgi:hypothetical protein
MGGGLPHGGRSEQARCRQGRLLEQAPHNLIVGPVDCHQGLSGRLGVTPGSYFSGVVGENQAEVERAVSDAAESPRFRKKPILVDEFKVVCLAD